MICCLDEFLLRKYNKDNYNCSHFVRDVWLELTGHDINDMVGRWNSGQLEQAMKSRRGLIKLEQPENPCLVIFFCTNAVPHIGVWIDEKVLHINENGVRHDPIEVFGFYKSWKFYSCASNW